MQEWIHRLFDIYNYKTLKPCNFYGKLRENYTQSEDFCFIQVGANDGVKFDGLYEFVSSHKCRGLVIEPLKVYFDSLEKNYASFPDITAIHRAIHHSEQKVMLYHVNPEKIDSLPEWSQGLGSLDPDHHKKSNTPSEYIIEEEVECTHLMQLVREYNFSHLNLLQIDVEGYDAEVIKMLDFSVLRPNIIKFEHSNMEKKVRSNIIRLLKAHGYRLFKEGCDLVAIYTDM